MRARMCAGRASATPILLSPRRRRHSPARVAHRISVHRVADRRRGQYSSWLTTNCFTSRCSALRSRELRRPSRRRSPGSTESPSTSSTRPDGAARRRFREFGGMSSQISPAWPPGGAPGPHSLVRSTDDDLLAQTALQQRTRPPGGHRLKHRVWTRTPPRTAEWARIRPALTGASPGGRRTCGTVSRAANAVHRTDRNGRRHPRSGPALTPHSMRRAAGGNTANHAFSQ